MEKIALKMAPDSMLFEFCPTKQPGQVFRFLADTPSIFWLSAAGIHRSAASSPGYLVGWCPFGAQSPAPIDKDCLQRLTQRFASTTHSTQKVSSLAQTTQ